LAKVGSSQQPKHAASKTDNNVRGSCAWRSVLGRGHTILTSRELIWCYACGWDARGDLTLNSMAQIHTSVTLFTSRDLTW